MPVAGCLPDVAANVGDRSEIIERACDGTTLLGALQDRQGTFVQLFCPVKLSPVPGNEPHPVKHFGDAGVISSFLAEAERFVIPAVGLVIISKRLG